ncbi:hypothetical protein C8R43DRAFT_977059 [Mycena crocata]|nr:hypothetical protein C8R43DRAFT_977059 [Mycena crocata]
MPHAETHLKQRRHLAAMWNNYFYAGTVLFATAAWIVAFAAQIAVTKSVGRAAVGVMWFAALLQPSLILGVLAVLASREIGAFRLQIVAFATMAAVFAVIGVDMSIFAGRASSGAMAAGWLVLAVVDILWVLAFSAEPGTPLARLLDSLAIPSGARTQNMDAEHQMQEASSRSADVGGSNGYEAEMTSDGSPDETKVAHDKIRELPDSLTGSPESGRDWTPLERRIVDRTQELSTDEEEAEEGSERAQSFGRSPPPSSKNRRAVYVDEHRHLSTIYDNAETIPDSDSSQRDSAHLYPYKVRARSDWIPRSPSEISFRKGDILHSAEKEGKKWWKVQKADGSVGSAPSNYFKVMNG